MTESVAWITERKNVLSLALGSVPSPCICASHRPSATTRDRAGALLRVSSRSTAAALLSKTVVCSLPAVILIVLWWKRGRIRVVDVVPLLPFFALGLAAAASTIWLEKNHVGASGEEWALAPIERILLAGRALWFYAGKLVWPHPLVFFYPRWQVSAAQPWQWLFPIGVLLVDRAALVAARAHRSRTAGGGDDLRRSPVSGARLLRRVSVPLLVRCRPLPVPRGACTDRALCRVLRGRRRTTRAARADPVAGRRARAARDAREPWASARPTSITISTRSIAARSPTTRSRGMPTSISRTCSPPKAAMRKRFRSRARQRGSRRRSRTRTTRSGVCC